MIRPWNMWAGKKGLHTLSLGKYWYHSFCNSKFIKSQEKLGSAPQASASSSPARLARGVVLPGARDATVAGHTRCTSTKDSPAGCFLIENYFQMYYRFN